MKLQFKHQPFQAEAAAAVCDVFRGQSLCAQAHRQGLGAAADRPLSLAGTGTGLCNQPLAPELTDARILKNLHTVQRRVGLPLSKALAGPGINLSVEMETGTGKTYTYVKTIYELNARYGWSRFIIVVPSVAVREGVYRSLQTTQEHFAGVRQAAAVFHLHLRPPRPGGPLRLRQRHSGHDYQHAGVQLGQEPADHRPAAGQLPGPPPHRRHRGHPAYSHH